MTTLLEIEDLNVWFDLEDGRRVARRPRGEPVARRGRAARTRRRIRLWEDDDSARRAGPASADGECVRARPPRGQGPPRRRRGERPTAPLGGHRDRLPGRDERAQSRPARSARRSSRRSSFTTRPKDRRRKRGQASCWSRSGSRRAARSAFPHELSGGMRQRAAIAMALSCNPKVLIADEPTTALDVMVQAQILELLDALCRDFGLALILVTHDLPVVAQLCDSALSCTRGRSSSAARRRALPRAASSLYAAPVRGDTRSQCAKRKDRVDSRRAAAPGPTARGLPVPAALRQRFRARASRSGRC